MGYHLGGMHKIASLIAAAALSLGAAPAFAADPQAELSRALEGRVAGEPVRCIDHSRIQSATIVPEIGILYRVGRTIYLNRPEGAERLDSFDILVTRLFGSSLCEREIVRLKDPTSSIPSGFVALGKFVPYDRPEGERR